MAKLASNTHVMDPRTHQMVELLAGSEPEPELAALVTNPQAWEDGELPAPATESAAGKDDANADSTPAAESKPAARKTAAKKPARGRSAAGEGDSGD